MMEPRLLRFKLNIIYLTGEEGPGENPAGHVYHKFDKRTVHEGEAEAKAIFKRERARIEAASGHVIKASCNIAERIWGWTPESKKFPPGR
ncbi:MAG TPA: hypothetical protein VMC43_01400 [Candidatus Paceibacterota bacterium]|nr:hypothetical protein [Candidatus Paceibacterota bacterium]